MVYRAVVGTAPKKGGIKKMKTGPTMLLKTNVEEISV
jgi:hypothetical protein